MGKAEGLELIAGTEKEAGHGSSKELRPGDLAELATVDHGEDDAGEAHSEKIEQKWGDVGDGRLDKGERGTPDECGGEQKKMGERSLRHGVWGDRREDGRAVGSIPHPATIRPSRGWGTQLLGGIDGLVAEYGAQNLGVKDLFRRGFHQVVVEDDEVGEVTGFEAPLGKFTELAVR